MSIIEISLQTASKKVGVEISSNQENDSIYRVKPVKNRWDGSKFTGSIFFVTVWSLVKLTWRNTVT